MAGLGSNADVVRLLFSGVDLLHFPQALQDDLIRVLSNADSLDTVADDLVSWRSAVLDGSRGLTDEAGEALEVTAQMRQFLESGTTIARIDAIPSIQRAATRFDAAYLSNVDQLDIDTYLRQISDDTALDFNGPDIAALRTSFEASVAAREETISAIMEAGGLNRQEAIAAMVDELGHRGDDVAPGLDEVAPAADDLAPGADEVTPVVDDVVEDGANLGDDLEGPNPRPNEGDDLGGAADDLDAVEDLEEAAQPNAGNRGNRGGRNAADEVEEGPRTPGRAQRFATGAAKFAWNFSGFGYVLNPFFKMGNDFMRAGRNLPNYVRRGFDFAFSDHQYSRGLFARADVHKTTNTAGLALDINAGRAAESPMNYLYMPKGAAKTPDDLTGALDNVGDSLRRAQGDVQQTVDQISSNLRTASSEITEAARQLDEAQVLTAQQSRLQAIAGRYGALSNDLIAGGNANLDTLTASLQANLRNTTDEVSQSIIQRGLDELEALKVAGSDSATTTAEAAEILGRLSTDMTQRADEAGRLVAQLTDRANDVLRRHQGILQSNIETSALGEVTQSVDLLNQNVTRIEGKIADIEAAPPARVGDKLIGGSVTARLAAHEVKPHLAEVSRYSDELTAITEDLRRGLDTSTITSGFDNALNSGDATRVENLRALAESLSGKADALEDVTGTSIDDALNGFDAARQAVSDMDNAVNQYTRTTKDANVDLFSEAGANTALQTEQNVGLIESPVTAAEKARYRQLVESGDIQPQLREGQTLDDILEYRPGEDAFNSDAGRGNAGRIKKTDEQKFFEYSFVNRDMDAAINAAENLLNSGDENRFWEALKWASLSYARNAEAGKVTDAARENEFLASFVTAIRDRAKGREGSGRRAGEFTDRIEQAVTRYFADIKALGANEQRTAWAEMWNRHRNLRYRGDYSNELAYKGSDPARIREREMAEAWKTSWGHDGRLGMNPGMRMWNTIPGAIWDNLPYKNSHFGSGRLALQTIGLQILPRAVVGGMLGYGIYSYGMDLIYGPKERRAKVADDLTEAKAFSEENIARIREGGQMIRQNYSQLNTNINNFIREQGRILDEKIAAATDDVERENYQRIKQQMLDSTQAFKDQFADDLAVSEAGIEQTLLELRRIDSHIQATTDLDNANELLKQQQDLINASEDVTHFVLDARLAQSEKAVQDILAAIESGTPMASAPTPADVSGDVDIPPGWTMEQPDPTVMKELSAQNVQAIRAQTDAVTQAYTQTSTRIDEYLTEQNAALDAKIAAARTEGNDEAVQKYEQIKVQLGQSIDSFKQKFAEDRRTATSEISAASTRMEELDSQIQASTSTTAIRRLLDEQQRVGDTLVNGIQQRIADRQEQFVSATRLLQQAIDSGVPMATVVTPSEITIRPPEETTGGPAREETTGGPAREETTGGPAREEPVVDNRPQWQKDLDAQKAEATRLLREATSDISIVGQYVSNPNSDAMGAAELVAAIQRQEDAILELQDELRRDGETQKASNMELTLQAVRMGQAEALQLQQDLLQVQEELDPLKQRASELGQQISQINTFADRGRATELTRQLQQTTQQIEAKRAEAENILTSIQQKARDNSDTMNQNVDIKYRYGNAYQIDEGLKKLGGGEHGLPYQLFGKGESGITSAAGGLLQTAWNGVKGIGDWWGNVKSNARTQSERNWYNAIETGVGIFGSLAVFNFLNKNLFDNQIQGVAKWGIMLAVGLYFLNRSGAIGEGMANTARGRSPFVAQSNGGGSDYAGATARTTGRTSYVPTSTERRTTGAGVEETNAGGGVSVPIKAADGSAVQHIVYVDGEITVQNMAGGLPTSASDIVVDPEAAQQIHATVQAELDRIKQENGIDPAMAGSGSHLPNPLKGRIDVVNINDASGDTLQSVSIDYRISDPETIDLTKPR